MKKIISLFLAGVLAAGLVGCGASSAGQAQSEGRAAGPEGYANGIFDTSYVHEVNVEIAQEDWADLLASPTEKTKYSTTVTIDGNEMREVSFATKGNTSLTQVAATDSDRYSFKLNFGKFVEGQTYGGLDKLNLNNLYSDATCLKDYLSYRIMAQTGVAAPLVSFAALSINGEYYGLYVAIEEVGNSFLERNYGEEAGELYKPEAEQFENMDMGGPMDGGRPGQDGQEGQVPGGGPGAQGGEGAPLPGEEEFPLPEDGDFPQSGQGGMGGFGAGNGASLVYSDDSAASYSDIFDNAETDAGEGDYQRVIAALRQLSTGKDLETCVDVEAVMRYFAAHNFVINFDSYTGNMLHNYYLYEEDGVLTMLPWDYNLAFGGFNGGSAAESVNWPIDSPLSGVLEEERPMWGQLAANESYLEMYHGYLDELLTNYFESGRFEEELGALYALLRPYVATDPTAFYTVEEFDTAVETLKAFCLLRAQSVRGQLKGAIPATAQGQQEDSSALVQAGEMNLRDMGGMGAGQMGSMDGAGGQGEWPAFGGEFEGGPGGG